LLCCRRLRRSSGHHSCGIAVEKPFGGICEFRERLVECRGGIVGCLLSLELAAGIRRVKGVKALGTRLGNWLNADQAKLLLLNADGKDLRSIRDLVMVAVLLGCGLRRAELSALKVEDMQNRQVHWAIVDLVGKGKRVRTVPIPMWVKEAVDHWTAAADISQGQVFRAVSRRGTPWGKGISENVIW